MAEPRTMEPDVRPAEDRVFGVVLCYDPEKRYGFLAIRGRSEDLFFHSSELVKAGMEDPRIGTRLTCRVAPSRKRDGGWCAVDLELA